MRRFFPFFGCGQRWNTFLAAALLAAIVAASIPRVVAAQDPAFETWLEQLRAEALRRGISKATVTKALAGITPLQRVIKADRNQPEFTQTFWRYLDSRVTAQRIERARAFGEELARGISEET